MKRKKSEKPRKVASRGIKDLVWGFLGKGEARKKGRFEIELDEMLEKRGTVVLGRVHLINLRDLIIKRKDADAALERAQRIADGVINQTLKEGDVFTRGSDGAYYFMFADGNEAAGELKCSVITDQIARLLAKEDSVFFKLELDKTVESVNRENVEAAKARIARAEAGDEDEDEDEGKDKHKQERKHKDRDEGEDMRRRLIHAREKKWMEQAIASVTPRTPEEPDAAADAAPAPEPPEDQDAGRPPPEGISVMYGTLWNVKTNLLTAYSCILMVREADGGIVRFRLRHRAEEHRRTLLAIDRYTQRQATARLRELLGSGQKTLIVLPVHYMTVDQDAPSLLYREGLAGLNEEERHHIVFELVDLPRDLSGVWAGKAVRNLRRVARTVMVRVTPDATNLDSWRDAGVHAAGFDVGTLSANEEALLPMLETFAERAERNGVKAFAYGLDTVSAATMAVSAGFDYIEGDAIRAPVESLEHVKPFETEDLLAHLMP